MGTVMHFTKTGVVPQGGIESCFVFVDVVDWLLEIVKRRSETPFEYEGEKGRTVEIMFTVFADLLREERGLSRRNPNGPCSGLMQAKTSRSSNKVYTINNVATRQTFVWPLTPSFNGHTSRPEAAKGPCGHTQRPRGRPAGAQPPQRSPHTTGGLR
jgi:hypothetical protein